MLSNLKKVETKELVEIHAIDRERRDVHGVDGGKVAARKQRHFQCSPKRADAGGHIAYESQIAT